MGLKEIVKHHIMVNAIQHSCAKPKNSVRRFNWSVLVLDEVGSRIISSCCSMSDMCSNGIA
ncbi:syntaxin-binding protein 2-like, partial [Myzus persicae]|uniref:syntaxin-binding protein 2-like n=1 Tax=Myzus persicae TaxID=13164 RepID=UPI000B931276